MTRTCAARLLAVWLTAQDEKDDVLAARYEERIIAAMMHAPDDRGQRPPGDSAPCPDCRSLNTDCKPATACYECGWWPGMKPGDRLARRVTAGGRQ